MNDKLLQKYGAVKIATTTANIPSSSPKKVPTPEDFGATPVPTQGPGFVKATADIAKSIGNFGKEIAGSIARPSETITKTIVQPLERASDKYVRPLLEPLNPNIKKLRDAGLTDEQIYGKPTSIADASVAGALTGKGSEAAKTPLEFGGALLENASNVVGGVGVKNVIKDGVQKAVLPSLKTLSLEGAALFGANTYGSQLREGKGAIEAIPGALESAAIGTVAGPVFGIAGRGLAKVGTSVSDGYAKKVLPSQFKDAVGGSQENLNKVLDNISIPNNTPNVGLRNQIDFIRERFPNLQEEVAARSGQPIKTTKEKGTTKFQTANQAQTIYDKAIQESQNAGQIAKAVDDQVKITPQDLISKLDEVLTTKKIANPAEVRAKAQKILENDFAGLNGEMKPSFANEKRVEAGQNSNKYKDGQLVGDTDVYDVLRDVYKKTLSDKVKDPNFETFLQNSSDNFDLSNLLNKLHGKEAYTERVGLGKALSNTGSAIETMGRVIPGNFGSPIEYLGKFIKAIPEFSSSERKLISTEVEKLVSRAKEIGAQFTDAEQRALNFVKRLEASNKTGETIEVNSQIINELKSLERVKKNEEAIKFFNKPNIDLQIGETNVDVAKFYDQYQAAKGAERGKVLENLYKAIVTETRGLSKKATLPKPEPIALPNSETVKINLPKKETPKVTTPTEEEKFYQDLIQYEKNKTISIPEEEALLQRLNDLELEKEQRQIMKEINQTAADSVDNFDLNTKEYTSKKNAGTGDLENTKIVDALGAGNKMDAQEAMDKIDSVLSLRKKARESAGIKDIDQEIKKVKEQLDKSTGKMGGFAQVTKDIPKELQPLAEEAKKYKSAEDFIKAQGTPVYHGTPNNSFLKKGMDFGDFAEPSAYKGNAIYFSSNPKVASSYTGADRLFDTTTHSPEVIQAVIGLKKPLVVDAKGSIWRKFETEINGEKIVGTRNLEKYAKENGYDGLVVNNVIDMRETPKKVTKNMLGTNYAVFNPKQILTKQQLIDLYNSVQN